MDTISEAIETENENSLLDFSTSRLNLFQGQDDNENGEEMGNLNENHYNNTDGSSISFQKFHDQREAQDFVSYRIDRDLLQLLYQNLFIYFLLFLYDIFCSSSLFNIEYGKRKKFKNKL